MYTNFLDITKDFMDLFIKAPFTVMVKATPKVVKVIHANASSHDYSELPSQQTYPVISIYEFPPKLSELFNASGFSYVGKLNTDEDDIIETATIYHEKVLLTFRFDVGIAAKSYYDFSALQMEMFKRFQTQAPALLGEEIIEGESVGVPVDFAIESTRVPRTDGVMEINYEFKFDVWVQAIEPQDIETIQELVITINQK